jgi:hypothetical protein
MDDELLESFRQIGLRLDREGRFWHQGELVTHAGVSAALHRMIDRLEDGRTIVRLDAERYAYLEVEDAPYQVRSVALERGAEGPLLFLLLGDGTEEELRYGSLRVGEADALYCEVKDGRFEARFSRPASRQLGELIEADETPEGTLFFLRAGAGRWPIRDR